MKSNQNQPDTLLSDLSKSPCSAEDYKRQRDHLAGALHRILVASKVLRPCEITGPELLMHGLDYADHLEQNIEDVDASERK